MNPPEPITYINNYQHFASCPTLLKSRLFLCFSDLWSHVFLTAALGSRHDYSTEWMGNIWDITGDDVVMDLALCCFHGPMESTYFVIADQK